MAHETRPRGGIVLLYIGWGGQGGRRGSGGSGGCRWASCADWWSCVGELLEELASTTRLGIVGRKLVSPIAPISTFARNSPKRWGQAGVIQAGVIQAEGGHQQRGPDLDGPAMGSRRIRVRRVRTHYKRTSETLAARLGMVWSRHVLAQILVGWVYGQASEVERVCAHGSMAVLYVVYEQPTSTPRYTRYRMACKHVPHSPQPKRKRAPRLAVADAAAWMARVACVQFA
jgi:hypothetical protein